MRVRARAAGSGWPFPSGDGREQEEQQKEKEKRDDLGKKEGGGKVVFFITFFWLNDVETVWCLKGLSTRLPSEPSPPRTLCFYSDVKKFPS